MAWCALAAAGALAGQPADPEGQRVMSVWVVQVEGDIDCTQMGREITRTLDEALSEGCGLVILSMDGERSRMDVVWDIAQRVRRDDPPVAGWAKGRDRVGAGPAAVALLGSSAWIEPGATLVSGPGSWIDPPLADRAERERTARELTGALYAEFKQRDADPSLADAIVEPTTTLWLSNESDGSRRLVREGTGGSVPVVTLDATGNANLAMDGAVAAEIGLLRVVPQGQATILRECGAQGASVRRVRIASGLEPGDARIRDALEGVDDALVEIARLLEARPADERVVTAEDRRRASDRAIAAIAEAEASLIDAEGTLAVYPELLARAVPGKTTVAKTRASQESAWRGVFQSRRDKLARLEERARKLAP